MNKLTYKVQVLNGENIVVELTSPKPLHALHNWDWAIKAGYPALGLDIQCLDSDGKAYSRDELYNVINALCF